MIRNTKLPQSLSKVLDSESRDFIVRPKRAYPSGTSRFLVLFGLAWTAFSSIFVFAFFGSVLAGGETHFELNGVPTTASSDNLEPLLFPAIFIGIFVLIGIGVTGAGVAKMFKKGGIFVGTPTRLVHFQNEKIRSIDWEQFSGDIRLSGNNENGTIALGLRTGRMVSRKNRSSQYVPDVIYMTGIPNAFEVEKICRERIKENDPTPAITES
jgi:hypothetical protein